MFVCVRMCTGAGMDLKCGHVRMFLVARAETCHMEAFSAARPAACYLLVFSAAPPSSCSRLPLQQLATWRCSLLLALQLDNLILESRLHSLQLPFFFCLLPFFPSLHHSTLDTPVRMVCLSTRQLAVGPCRFALFPWRLSSQSAWHLGAVHVPTYLPTCLCCMVCFFCIRILPFAFSILLSAVCKTCFAFLLSALPLSVFVFLSLSQPFVFFS